MNIDGIHLELTNKCTLKCPKCPRTTFIDKFGISKWTNQDLNLINLKNFIDVPLAGKTLFLSGNYGDPIYYDDLFELIYWAKTQDAKINLVTNGSYKKISWWEKLSSHLTKDDEVMFSIDGIPENFNQYRVNADWNSIETGIKVISSSPAKSIWKYIPFSFNQDNIDQARALSRELGVTEFVVAPSDRWTDDEDPLKPSKHFGARETSILKWYNSDRTNKVAPKCTTLYNQHYISAAGFYMPCCYVGDYHFYYKSEFYKNRSAYDISKTTLTQVLVESKSFYENIEKTLPAYCTFNCPQV